MRVHVFVCVCACVYACACVTVCACMCIMCLFVCVHSLPEEIVHNSLHNFKGIVATSCSYNNNCYNLQIGGLNLLIKKGGHHAMQVPNALAL